MYKGKYVSELSINEVKEYYDELRENYPRTDEQWADFKMLQEKLIVFAYKILDGKTNGDVIDADALVYWECNGDCDMCCDDDKCGMVKEAPTIIEADETE